MLHNAAFESIFKGMGWGGNKLWNQFRKLFGVPFFRVCTLFCNVLHEDDLTSLLCYFHINSQFVTWITPPLQEIDAVFPSVKMAEESHRVYAPHWGYSAFFSIRCQLFWAAEYINTVQISRCKNITLHDSMQICFIIVFHRCHAMKWTHKLFQLDYFGLKRKLKVNLIIIIILSSSSHEYTSTQSYCNCITEHTFMEYINIWKYFIDLDRDKLIGVYMWISLNLIYFNLYLN